MDFQYMFYFRYPLALMEVVAGPVIPWRALATQLGQSFDESSWAPPGQQNP